MHHGEEGLIDISTRVYYLTSLFKYIMKKNNIIVLYENEAIFDTVIIKSDKI